MSFVGEFVCNTRNIVAQGFRSLPVLTSSAVLTLGLIQGNVNFILFAVGLLVLAPLGALLLNVATEFIFSYFPRIFPTPLWQVPAADAGQCNLFALLPNGPPTPFNVVPTYWTTVTMFFYTYVFLNGLKLYRWQSHSRASVEAVEYRKYQTAIALFIIALLATVSIAFRAATSCETALGMSLGVLVGVLLGYGWYEALKACGLGQLDDIFGIFNRLLPLQSYEDNEPNVCVPT